MRLYVWTDGTPGYISAEVAVRDLEGVDEARGWADDWWTALPRTRVISRAEALMRYREALEAWERRDDAVMQRTEVAEILESRRGTAVREASEGCRMAAAALAADDDEMIREAVNEHAHEGCGWSFPDEPRPPRRLNAVR